MLDPRRRSEAHERHPPLPVIPENKIANPEAVAALIDHTLLKPEAAHEDILRICEEAREFGFASVCINPYWVRAAKQALAGSPVRVCTVIGFPLGANDTKTKYFEAETALAHGASELDMVQNIGALRSRDFDFVQGEIATLAALAHAHGAILKVILETCLLSDEEKSCASRLAVEASADFVKTSTGFSSSGATVGDVRLMRSVVKDRAGVKASGGVRTLNALQQMVAAGANRIGTSSGLSIMRELRIINTAEPVQGSEIAGSDIASVRENSY